MKGDLNIEKKAIKGVPSVKIYLTTRNVIPPFLFSIARLYQFGNKENFLLGRRYKMQAKDILG